MVVLEYQVVTVGVVQLHNPSQVATLETGLEDQSRVLIVLFNVKGFQVRVVSVDLPLDLQALLVIFLLLQLLGGSVRSLLLARAALG